MYSTLSFSEANQQRGGTTGKLQNNKQTILRHVIKLLTFNCKGTLS